MSLFTTLLRTACVLAILLCSISFSAHAQTITSASGDTLATVSNNVFLDGAGNMLFSISASGSILDANSDTLGLISNGEDFYDGGGYLIGSVNSSGVVKDYSGADLGEIESNGTVKDGEGNVLGHVSTLSASHAGLFFFFTMLTIGL